jgi:hypothetical protein
MNVTVESRRVNLPDFFIVGAAKSATTSLHTYLKQHPNIFLPERKELYFLAFGGETPCFKLADGTPREKVGVNREEYFKIYRNTPEACLAGDTSSWYLYYYKEVIRNIQELYGTQAGKIKIIMVLRNPVDRAWSHYSMHRGMGIIDLPFPEAAAPGSGSFRERITGPDAGYFPGYDYIGFGMYSRQVEAFLEAFDQVKIFLYEDFSENSRAVIDEITRFLGLEPLDRLKKEKRLNVSGAPRSGLAALVSRLVFRPYFLKKLFRSLLPAPLRYKIKMNISRFLFKKKYMSREDRRMLIDIYRRDIRLLEKTLNRDLGAWLNENGQNSRL